MTSPNLLIFSTLPIIVFKRYLIANVVPKEIISSTLFHHNKKFSPVVLSNFENLDFEFIKNNIAQRKCKIDFVKIENISHEIKKLEENLNTLVISKENALKNYKKTLVSIVESQEVRKQLKIVKNNLAKLKDEFSLIVLSIPNVINHKVRANWSVLPKKSLKREFENQLVINYDDISNIIHKNIGTISLKYLDGNLALSKFIIMESGYDWWRKTGFIPIALSDIIKTIPVECCNREIFSNNIALINSKLDNTEEINPYNFLFLKGSGTLEAFCSYFMRTRISNKSLPVKLMTLGNNYTNIEGLINETSTISILLAADAEDKLLNELDKFQELLKKFWIDHFNIRVVATVTEYEHLKSWEGYRYVIKTDHPNGVTLATISVIGNYISRRIMINDINDVNLYLVYAEVMNYDSLLSAIKFNQENLIYEYESEWFDPVLK